MTTTYVLEESVTTSEKQEEIQTFLDGTKFQVPWQRILVMNNSFINNRFLPVLSPRQTKVMTASLHIYSGKENIVLDNVFMYH